MDRIKIIALFGPSGAGKDTVQRWIIKNMPEFHGIISCTTRPPREKEVDGVDYHFLTNEAFADKVLNLDMLEATCFREWYYGTSIEDLDKNKVNIGVFNIDGINCLLEDERIEVIPILITIDDKTRLKRVLDREREPNCAEACRRFLADKKDMENIDFSYLTFVNKKLSNVKPILLKALDEFAK